jgi:FKBP-type peptidyl-prolyl cis-trans isomerase SlyD
MSGGFFDLKQPKKGDPMSDENKVADEKVVSLHYTLTSDEGEVLDSSQGGEPLQFIQGQGQIIPGLEKELYDMEVGDEKQVTVAPADGYGEHQPDQVQTLPREAFPDDMEIEEGMAVQMRDSNSGQVYQAVITNVAAESVQVDFNHPLAGENLNFEVKIAGLRDASDEEIAHGHVH